MSLISIVIPLYNEAENLLPLHQRLRSVLSASGHDYELLFIDDGSSDNSPKQVLQIQQQDSHVKSLRLSRNFGHQAALLAGLRESRGDCVISLDADLQHPPELIPLLIEQWQQGAKIVNTQRKDNGLSSKNLTSGIFYRLFSRLSGLNMQTGLADFRLLDRQVVETLSDTDERALFLRGILQWMGFTQSVVEYTPEKRLHGKTKYSWRRMMKLALEGITSFSVKPLRIATLLGFFFSAIAFTYLVFALYGWWFTDRNIEGWTSVIGSVLFLGGIQLICLGIIGEYIGKIYKEVKHRPHYIIESRSGFDHD